MVIKHLFSENDTELKSLRDNFSKFGDNPKNEQLQVYLTVLEVINTSENETATKEKLLKQNDFTWSMKFLIPNYYHYLYNMQENCQAKSIFITVTIHC